MAIDITNVLDVLQRKISSFDSSGNTQDLQYLLSGALRADRSSTIVYDTLNDLPDLTIDSDFAGQENMVYLKDQENLYFKDYTNRKWKPLPVYLYYNVGSNYGFTVGGSPGTTAARTTDRYPFFAPFTSATDIGDFNFPIGAYDGAGGLNSFTEGFIYGGVSPPGEGVKKFNMVNFTGSSTHIPIPIRTKFAAGCSDLNESKGYVIGGGTPGPTQLNTIYQFDFVSTTPRSLVGNTPTGFYKNTGVSAALKGYWGGDALVGSSVIYEFPYSSSTTVTNIGNINPAPPAFPSNQDNAMANSSTEYGYFSGGSRQPGNGYVTQVEKFSFSVPGNSVVMGNLTQARSWGAGANSQTEGFVTGGFAGTGGLNTIDKFPFASDTNAVDAGDLSLARNRTHGFNY